MSVAELLGDREPGVERRLVRRFVDGLPEYRLEDVLLRQMREFGQEEAARKRRIALLGLRGADVVRMLDDTECHVYVCGLKATEAGVDAAFADACRQHGRDWNELVPLLRASGRYHVETY